VSLKDVSLNIIEPAVVHELLMKLPAAGWQGIFDPQGGLAILIAR